MATPLFKVSVLKLTRPKLIWLYFMRFTLKKIVGSVCKLICVLPPPDSFDIDNDSSCMEMTSLREKRFGIFNLPVTVGLVKAISQLFSASDPTKRKFLMR